MASRAVPTPAIALADLLGCTDAPAVFALFRRLRYPVEPHPIPVPLDPDDLPATLREGVAARYPLARIGGARPGDPSLDVTFFVLHDGDQQSRLVRGISQMWTRRFPGEHLLVFAATPRPGTDGFDRLTFVNTRRLGAGAQVRVKLHKLIVERCHPTRHDLDTLNRIALPAATPAARAVYDIQCDAFKIERVTDEFYRGYSRLFHAVLKRIEAENPNVRAPSGQPWQRLFTQRLFGRLMFLYFLQKKGALNGNPRFVADWYDRAVREGRSFYLDILTPLFFDTLNRQRPGHDSPIFGSVPYLNGGLFAPDADLPAFVNVPNDIFDTNGTDGLLYFLNTHNFTVEEDTPLEVEVALDPEMLGKVFENLLEAEERGQSGTFYTPRPVVAFMCREALAAYLARATAIGLDRLGWLLDEAETGEPARDDAGHERLTFTTLPRALSESIERALLAVRVLDPAVGSGAFPLGMLALLVGVRRALYRIAGAPIDPASHLVEGWKRNFIRDCLYGVDIKPEAIAIARLRLWLSLLVDAADPFKMEPLPNLDYKLMAGDSLIETFEGVEIYPTRPAAPTAEAAQATLLDTSAAPALIIQLHKLQDAYFQPEPGADRAVLKQQIQATEANIVRAALRERREAEASQLASLTQRMAKFQKTPVPAQLNAEYAELTRRIDRTDESLRAIDAGKPLPFFLYGLHFASVFKEQVNGKERDGFDIVIANPPYVRHEKVPPATLATLKSTYPDVAHGMADLYVYFYARALQLLHDGGTLCFISSNKFFRAGYGKGLRETLKDQTSVRTIIDFGDFPVFDAAAYPCIVITDRGCPAEDHDFCGLTADHEIDLDKLDEALAADGQLVPQTEGVYPPLSTRAITVLADKLLALGTPLGSYLAGGMFYGIKTGRNEAFVVDQATRDRLVREHSRSAEVLKPYLRGQDIGRWVNHPSGLWLIFTRQGINIHDYPAIERYLSQYREDLEPLQPGQKGRGRKPGPYKWYEIQDTVEYYSAFERPKIIYPEFAPWPEFSIDVQSYYVNNKIYCLGIADPVLVALLNSKVMALALARKCSGVHGGTLEHRTIWVKQLPIVEPSDADKQRLTALVDEQQALGGAGPRAEELEREVDAIVYRTYGLSQDEIKIIEDWHAERRTLLGAGKRGKAPEETNGDS
jgi:Eco57I restriction-modification methylase